MGSIVKQSEPVDPGHATIHKPWRLGLTGWILILGLIALNVGVLFEYVDWNKRTIGWLLYRIDPRYWPLWPIPVLWGIVAWFVNNALKNRFRWIEKKQTWIKAGIVLGCFYWMFRLGGWTFAVIRKKIYYRLYVAYIMGPIALYLSDGTASWKLLISPALAAVIIALLLRVASQQRKKSHESKSRIEKSVETRD